MRFIYSAATYFPSAPFYWVIATLRIGNKFNSYVDLVVFSAAEETFRSSSKGNSISLRFNPSEWEREKRRPVRTNSHPWWENQCRQWRKFAFDSHEGWKKFKLTLSRRSFAFRRRKFTKCFRCRCRYKGNHIIGLTLLCHQMAISATRNFHSKEGK